MVKLIQFEYRKHFLKTSVLLAVIIFSVLNVVKINGIYDSNSLFSHNYFGPWESMYWEMYEDFSGKITDEKIEKLIVIYRPLAEQTADHTASTAMDNPDTYTGNLYTDAYFFSGCFVKPMEYFYMYRSYANGVAAAAKENVAFFETLGNTYEYRKNAAIAELFQGRVVTDFTYTEMYQYYLQYDFSAFLALLICLYGLMNVFVAEKETEMDTLLLTTKSGGFKTVLAKLISSILFVCGICVWFWLVDFIAFSCIFGSLKAASAPLYALENFANTSINVSLGQYAALSGIVKTTGVLVLGMAFLLISCFFKNSLLPFLSSLSITIVLIYAHETFMSSGRILRKIINPFALIANRVLFRQTEFINLFGFPVPSYAAALLCAAIWNVLLITGIVIFVRKSTIRKNGGETACRYLNMK